MKVHVLIVTHPFEFSTVLGVFLNKADAEDERIIAKKKDTSKGYDDFDIEEHEVK